MYSCRNLNCKNSSLEHGWLVSKKQNCPVCGDEMMSEHEIDIERNQIERNGRRQYYKDIVESKLGRALREEESLDMWIDVMFK